MSCVPSVVVAGATGFAGALAAALLWRHPDFELRAITARSETGRRLDDLYPHHRVPLELEPLDLERHGDVDAAVIAYPHGASAPVAAGFRSAGARVVDLSADFRLDDVGVYEEWYVPHLHAELLASAVYGLPELHRDEIPGADLVACPGCFPTAALLALAPLAEAGLIADVVIDAKTGVSGAGRTPTAEDPLRLRRRERRPLRRRSPPAHARVGPGTGQNGKPSRPPPSRRTCSRSIRASCSPAT